MTTSNPSVRLVRIAARMFLLLVQVAWFFPGVGAWLLLGLLSGGVVHAVTGDRLRAERCSQPEPWILWPMILMDEIPLDE